MDGLSTADARARAVQYGSNALPEHASTPLWRRVLQQFASPLIYLLLFALAFDVAMWVHDGLQGWPVEAVAIGAILLLNAALGVYHEARSESALARLKALGGHRAWVLRDGRAVHLPTHAIVPGDWIRLEAGDRVPADGTLTRARGALLDESILTGESVPVDKGDDDEAFSGTLLVRGTTFLIVTRTGASSAMGRLASTLGEIDAAATPLERRVDALGRRIARAVLLLAAALGLLGLAAEGLARAPQTLIFAVALAVAAVPEGLPAVLTVALARGVERMARHRAVVRRLSAVEALGSVTVIATDKTGTITANRMEVRALDVVDPARALDAIVLANDADLDTGAGDPLDLGLLRYAADQGADVAAIRHRSRVVATRPFDSAWKFAGVTIDVDGRHVSYVKGAPEALLARCAPESPDGRTWAERADAHARDGLRVLAIAQADGEIDDARLTMLGFALFWDPPRPEVAGAVRLAHDAGIRVAMVTGDHPSTALAVARQIGLPASRALTGDEIAAIEPSALAAATAEVDVFARVRPEQKLRLVEALQRGGAVVAMTGDGVNDAAALKRADVGVAMGQRGSDVSREVADLVLLDDNFATIVGAVDEGRGIYENIQTFLRFLFSTNLSEVLLVAGGLVLAFALDLRDRAGALVLPLTAAQILWINLVTDGLPALALALDRTPGLMRQPPRPVSEPLLDARSVRFVAAAGGINALLAFGAIGLATLLGHGIDESRAVGFHFMAISQLVLAYPCRHARAERLPNRALHAAVATGIAIQVGVAVLPFAARLLGHAALPPVLWLIVASGAALAWACATLLSRVLWPPQRGGDEGNGDQDQGTGGLGDEGTRGPRDEGTGADSEITRCEIVR
jgi:Ca2+-transporting ATPase